MVNKYNKQPKLEFKEQYKNISNNKHNELVNSVYEDELLGLIKTQSIKTINKLTKKTPCRVFMSMYDKDEKHSICSFIVPYDTAYLFVENGWLKSSNSPIEFAKIDMDSLENMSMCYVFNDFNQDTVKKIARLKGLKNSYTPRIYVRDRWDNIVQVNKIKINKNVMKKWKDSEKTNKLDLSDEYSEYSKSEN